MNKLDKKRALFTKRIDDSVDSMLFHHPEYSQEIGNIHTEFNVMTRNCKTMTQLCASRRRAENRLIAVALAS